MENKKHYIKVERHKWPDEIAREKQETRKRFMIAMGFLICFVAGWTVSTFGNPTAGLNNAAAGNHTSKFDQVYEIMREEWYFGKDIENLDDYLMANALQGLTVNEYDEHTNYLEADRAEKYMTSLEGTLVGIGVSFMKNDEGMLITRVYADSPARKNGVKEGDVLVKVNGISIKEKAEDEIVELVKGEEGTSVSLEFIRDDKTYKKDLIRAQVNTSVYGYVKDNVGVMEFSRFTENSATEVASYLKEFEKQGIDDLIIDMRDNGGGYLTTMIDVASMFLKENTLIFQEEARNGKVQKQYTKKMKRFDYDHLVILVNEGTASAAEALTAALKEQGDAVVVGVTTYGKGTVQEPIVFKDGSYLKYTIAEWLTPKGEKINKKGIAPDIEVKLDEAVNHIMTDEKKSYTLDQVGIMVADAQVMLKFLGYEVDRKDGYFSKDTDVAVKAYQKDHAMKVNGVVNKELNVSLLSEAQQKWFSEKETLDLQMKKAMEVANGR